MELVAAEVADRHAIGRPAHGLVRDFLRVEVVGAGLAASILPDDDRARRSGVEEARSALLDDPGGDEEAVVSLPGPLHSALAVMSLSPVLSSARRG
jgi:hypothetical protein